MPGSNRNRYSQKNTDTENCTGDNTKEKTGYRKLPDNLSRKPDESISTAGNTANAKNSRTGKRKEDKEKEQ